MPETGCGWKNDAPDPNFLPTHDNEGVRFDKALFDGVRTELAEHFGGVTIYMCSSQ